ncbi:hypothetical protein [Enterovirga rhinocerotis]|uniref:Uncharacterized protein n=1 Tax=Enterovirga rhinocerotis TaxID=1339210 RepID=A0A4R7BWK7_9HYPH|nr:hypothetical protein [Enterovirga rhinocerotis]TDR90288.1 hypothetical protein EV668_3134 [Enterovirga rhinocerotis]
MRRKYIGRPPTPLSIDLHLSLDKLPIFDNFVEFGLNMGVTPFTAPVVLPNGLIVPRKCQFSIGENGFAPLSYMTWNTAIISLVVKVWNWRGYEDEARALFATTGEQNWDDERRVRANAFIAGMKQDGVWDSLRIAYLFANRFSSIGRTNMKAPGTYTAALGGDTVPAFSINRGFKGDGVSGHLDLGGTLASVPGVTPDNMSVFVWSLTTGADTGREFGTIGSTLSSLQISNGTIFRVRANSSTQFDTPNTVGQGLFGFSRNGNAVNIYRNGELLATQTEAPTAFGSGNMSILRSMNAFSARQIAAVMIGTSVTPEQAAGMYRQVGDYLRAVGAVS